MDQSYFKNVMDSSAKCIIFKILFLHNQAVQKHADGGFDRKNLETVVSGRKLHDSKKRRA
jgi:hypothetical protein